MRLLPFVGFLVNILTGASALAGRPIQENIKCPVGDEEVAVTGTASCSSSGRFRTMSFWAPSSCDFVTRLPVCPGNKLPLYKEFTSAEILKLERYIETDTYRNLKSNSRFFRAFKLESFLNTEAEMGFGYELLLNGIWYDDPKSTYQVGDYLSAFFTEAEEFISNASKEDRPYDRTVVAYFYYLNDDEENASRHLSEVRKSEAYGEELLSTYTEAIENCIRGLRQDCSPSDVISAE